MIVRIAFSIPATDEPEIKSLPPPSGMRHLSTIEGKNKMTFVFYHFRYAPQSWKEWQHVASMKVQMLKILPGATFDDDTAVNIDEVRGPVYTVSELGKHFTDFIKWPKPQFPRGAGEQYQKLCIHAKRLHYEGLMHVEQLIATSIRFNEAMPEIADHPKRGKQGFRQAIRMAISAYRFALEHRHEWRVKLTKAQRRRALQEAAYKTAEAKRKKTANERAKAASMRKMGVRIAEISEALNVSPATVKRWLKEEKTAH